MSRQYPGALSDAHRRMALSDLNRFYAWKALGEPERHATDQECVAHFLDVMSKCVFASGHFEIVSADDDSPMFV